MTFFLFSLTLILLVSCACLSAIETAVTAASVGRIHQLKKNGNQRASAVLKLLKTRDAVISSLLVFNSFINTVATTIATSLIISIYGEGVGTIIASMLMAVIIIVFAEVVPKAIAVAKAEQIIIYVVNFIEKLLIILKPALVLLNLILNAFCKIFNIKLTQNISGTDEVRSIIEHQHSEGNVFKSDRDMLGGVLDIGSIKINEIMIHRSHIVSINVDLTMKEIIAQALDSSHTRIPVWSRSSDNIIGILHVKNLTKALYRNNFDDSRLSLKDFISDPWFIPEHALASMQLHAFRQKRSHIAIVIDEYGDLMGVITLEDILEEIVGQIEDEHDYVDNRIIKKRDDLYLIDGAISIRDVNRELCWNLPDDNASTLAGFVIHNMHKLPEIGEKLEIMNLRITIHKKSSNRIKSLAVEVLPENTGAEDNVISDR